MIETFVQGWVCGGLWWPTGAVATKAICESVTNEIANFIGAAPDALELVEAVLLNHSNDFRDGAMFTADTIILVRHTRHTDKGTIIRENSYPITRFPSLSSLVNSDVWSCDGVCFDMDSADA